jgi:hypothetical protein
MHRIVLMIVNTVMQHVENCNSNLRIIRSVKFHAMAAWPWPIPRAKNTYHLRFIPEEVAEVSQIFLRDTHVLPKLVSYEEHCRRDRW